MFCMAGLALHAQKSVLETAGEVMPGLASFGLIENSCTPDLLLGGLYEVIARNIHQAYVQGELARGRTMRENASMLPWDELPETLRESNRAQALHISTKLQRVNCAVRPVRDWGESLLEFEPDEIELLAKMEHQRWVEERTAEGWTYKDGKKDAERKTSPHMTGWSSLDESVKDYDRGAVRNIPALVAQAGYEIYHLPE